MKTTSNNLLSDSESVAVAMALEQMIHYAEQVRCNDVPGDDPIYGRIDDAKAVLAALSAIAVGKK